MFKGYQGRLKSYQASISIKSTLKQHAAMWWVPSCDSSLVSLLRYFPSTNLVDRADNCYTSLYFYFSSFSMFIRSRILKLVVICSCCSFLFFPPIYLFHPTLFYSSFYSLFCFLPLFIQFIFWSPLWFSFQICYPFFCLFLLLCPVCFSLTMLCSYSICSLW